TTCGGRPSSCPRGGCIRDSFHVERNFPITQARRVTQGLFFWLFVGCFCFYDWSYRDFGCLSLTGGWGVEPLLKLELRPFLSG
ncbi:MAG: hypothetical protein QGG12_08195, partial [Prochlorococcaceae cyanobacterium ETNP18_MAG_14]|nr:hypothetical protein [Prochlorococcaceae cyanobacterium ETNP18_MAG_14]